MQENTKQNINEKKFGDILESVKSFLLKQDSDSALRVITLWALNIGVSDIHYDNTETDIVVRFRIDWVLEDVFRLEKKEYKLLIERMKYSSGLKLNINHIPQDWKYSIDENWWKIDIRVSTLPIKWWENMVCRVLDSSKAIVDFKNLWLFWTSERMIKRAINKKNWLILVTWPTGSGKTTTLYTILKEISTRDKKTITLEDPIEYQLSSVIQSEINEKNWYTYDLWLKALLRQDPDIIMVWEIRDTETLNTAANASLTGHLVLSTLHTKSAGETLERIINMWIQPYILSSAVDTIVAQRLVRKICPHCKKEVEKTPWEKQIIDIMLKEIGMNALKSENTKIYKWEWCEHCSGSWYKGRIWIFEILTLSQKLRDLIKKWESTDKIIEEAKSLDFISLKQDGIIKAIKGHTTIEEIFRVL